MAKEVCLSSSYVCVALANLGLPLDHGPISLMPPPHRVRHGARHAAATAVEVTKTLRHSALFATRSQKLDQPRHDGEHDDADDHDRQVIADEGEIAEEVACVSERADPEHRPGEAVAQETRIRHLAHSADEGRERAHDRHESRDEHGLAAVAFIEAPRALE